MIWKTLTKVFVFFSICMALSAAIECGVRKINHQKRRLSNKGTLNYAGQWPWFATLRFKSEDELFCFASLINEFTLVTGEK